MALIKVQHAFMPESGLAEDMIVNSFYFTGPIGNPTPIQSIGEAMRDFYETGGGINGSLQLSNFLAYGAIAATAHQVKVYNMGDAGPRAPIGTWTGGGLVSNTIAPMPAEVSLCLSYQGAPASGTNPKRRRGRIYLGPLGTSSSDIDAGSSRSRPSYDLMNAALGAGVGLRADMFALGYTWVIYSSATQSASIPNDGTVAVTPIASFSVDNAWDTQRRRGVSPTSRMTTPAIV